MQIGTRVNLFFLATLAAVLASTTAVMHVIRLNQLHHEIDEQLTIGLNVLNAAVDNKGNAPRWMTGSHNLLLGIDPAEEQTRWLVAAGDGEVLDMSENLKASDPDGLRERLAALALAAPPGRSALEFADDQGDAWKAMILVMKGSVTQGEKPSVLRLSVTASVQTSIDAAYRLVLWRSGIGAAVWVVVALLGRRLSNRVLRPLRDMAAAVRGITANDLSRRIPQPDTRDEVAELSAAFNDLMNRVEEAFQRKQRFAAEASHQLRTPLTVLIGQVEVALRREREPKEYVETLQKVQTQGRQLFRLVELLLVLARVDSENALPRPEELDAEEWLRERLDVWREHPRFPDMRIVASERPVRLRAVPTLLAQAVDNLLENACKYSEPESPIELYIGRKGEMAVVEVKDRGAGMSAEDVQRAFEPFFRTEDTRRRGVPGYGIGLSVVKRVTEAMGGNVRLASRPGVGTTVTIEMPLHGETAF